MDFKKVFISTSSFAQYDSQPIELLKEANFIVKLNPYGRTLVEPEIQDAVKDCNLLIAGTEPLSRSVLESAKKLKIISRCGAGLDNVDLIAAQEIGIKVFNTPFGPTQAVAELTTGVILDLLRKITFMDRELRAGKWQKKMGNLLQNKRVGFIGFGNIGQTVAELLLPFNVEISYYDIRTLPSCEKYRRLELEPLLSCSDIITIHISVSPNTKTIIGAKELKLMKQGSWLVNMSRGGLIDENALYKALESEHLSGAALDVFEREPYIGELTKLNNVVLTPHVGSYAKEARIQMEIDAVKNLLKTIKRA
ncbi:MAG: hydroxyacid dehydrogenase [Gammaproteobacteria bacterium]|nr:hydroxyacid dehydrogenase [Gammaproteobacteria bacterium]HJP19822.1 phosphoglycerate dehydrogenase [Nitrospinota bacterium]|tara:strand:- start:22617 stop:23540 length:924 start_codon:yes stop_codon:yes gene_type:complete